MKKPLLERFQQLAGIKPLYEVEDASPGASGPGLKPKTDVERVMKLLDQYVDSRVEYEQIIRAVIEFDVDGKEAAITKAFSDYPTLRSALLGQKTLSDPEDNTQTYKFQSDDEYTVDGDGSGDGEEDHSWAEEYLSDSGTLHQSYKGGNNIDYGPDSWEQFKGKYTLNNERIGYVKDDGSLHSAPLPTSVGENEQLMAYITSNYQEDGSVPVVGSN